MSEALDLLTYFSTGIGVLATGILIVLMRNGERSGLTAEHWCFFGMFLGLLIFDVSKELAWIAPETYSIMRRIPGRLCPTIGVTWLLVTLVHRKRKSNIV